VSAELSSMAPPRGKLRRVKLVALQACVLVVGAVALELGLRGWLAVRGKRHDAVEVQRRFEAFVHGDTRFAPLQRDGGDPARTLGITTPFVHPFLGWSRVDFKERVENDLRRIQSTDTRADYEILILGGSVAGHFCQHGVGVLAERLAADARFAGRRVTFFSYGLASYKAPQTLALAQELLALGLTPEAIVLIDGFNEVAIGNENAAHGSHPSFPSVPIWGPLVENGALDREAAELIGELARVQRELEESAQRALSWKAHVSAVISKLWMNRLEGLAAQRSSAQQRLTARRKDELAELVLHGPPFDVDPRAATASAARTWEENSRSLHGLCARRGIAYVHVLQPTLYDTGSKPLAEVELQRARASQEWIDGVHFGYPLLREAGRRLGAEGTLFVDASMAFEQIAEPLYFDACHFTAPGQRVLAERVASALLGIR
jgi:hypothetical protein